jgi:hypothetical protein
MIAMAVTIVFVQEQLLMFIPNVQLTTLLIILFVTVFTFKESFLMIVVYIFLDNLFLGGLNPFTMGAMFVAWMLIPIIWHTVLRKTKNVQILAFFGFFFGILYGWVFIPFTMIQTEVFELWPYLLADIPFQGIMATTNFLTVLWLYEPLHQVIEKEMPSLGMKQVATDKNL